ncbi:unnamed protein product [Pedinophyceae sp. YPF-701]|nr:unnamed protein product [Pedinophyceae sp. YPF-701]
MHIPHVPASEASYATMEAIGACVSRCTVPEPPWSGGPPRKRLCACRPSSGQPASGSELEFSSTSEPSVCIHPQGLARSLEAVRRGRPLVQCISNAVSVDIMANVLLATGMNAAMVSCEREAGEFAARAAAAVSINLGTPAASDEWVRGTDAAVTAALAEGKPWVLDPVALSASTWRYDRATDLCRRRPTVVRLNASEAIALAAVLVPHKSDRPNIAASPDATHASLAAKPHAVAIARCLDTVVCVTGEVDLVTDGRRIILVKNGVSGMRSITALGCSLSSLVAGFVAVRCGRTNDSDDEDGEAAGPAASVLEATAHATCFYGVCGEVAMTQGGAKGPGSLRAAFLDALAAVGPEELQSLANMTLEVVA